MRFVQKKHYSFSPIDCRAKNATNNMYMYSSTDSITHCVSCVHTVHKLYNEQAYSTSRSNARSNYYLSKIPGSKTHHTAYMIQRSKLSVYDPPFPNVPLLMF